MAIKYLEGVPKDVLSPEMETALQTTNSLLKVLISKEDITITATSNGKHMVNSKHFDVPCNAADIRIWDIIGFIAFLIGIELGKDYDVVFEGDHIHIEYDPD